MKKKLFPAGLLSLFFLLVSVAIAYANGAVFYGKNIGYGNAIIDLGVQPNNQHLWAATHYEYTTFPSQIMSQIGSTVWTTYGTCGSSIYNYKQYTSVNNSWMIRLSSKSYNSGQLYKYDYPCSPTTLSVRRNSVVHYWQTSESPYPYGSANEAQASPNHSPTFTDVPVGHWAYTYIEPIYQIGIMDQIALLHNCFVDSFCPNQAISRGEMAYFLERGIRGKNYYFQQGSGAVFSDVPQSYENTWMGYPLSNVVGIIEKLYADGITGGCSIAPLRYCPDDNVTRAQMAVFLLRVEHGAGYQPPAISFTSFSDVPGNHWAAAWIQQLYNEGITGGCQSVPLMYCPENQVTRAEMAVFLQRTFAP